MEHCKAPHALSCGECARLQPLFARIDRLREGRGRVLVAIDGGSASGKTTLAALLARTYGATVVHMDDFFLRPEQRSAQRLREPGGNVDHERFAQEVLAPMRRAEAFLYRPYDCHTRTIGGGVRMTPGDVCVIEGAYSLHPGLEAAYDLRVLLRIDARTQSARILRRNGEAMHERFMREWIPLENLYFEKTGIERRCDVILRALPDGDGALCAWEEDG